MNKSGQATRSFRAHSNNHGVILLTIILLTIIFSLIVIGIMSINVSHVKTGEKVIDNIRTEELAKGIFYQKQQALISGSGSTPTQEVIDGKTYTVQVDCQPSSGPNETGKLTVCIGDNCQVLCTPNCTGLECGSDGCCGYCPPGCTPPETCVSGYCVVPD